jgi:hypothetical protein
VAPFETDVQLLNVGALLGVLERLPCPACGIVFAVRPGSDDWKLTSPADRACGTCADARSALNAVTAEMGWPRQFEGVYHERRARRVRAALGQEWASVYRYAAWAEEMELAGDRAGSDACRAAADLLQAIEERVADG